MQGNKDVEDIHISATQHMRKIIRMLFVEIICAEIWRSVEGCRNFALLLVLTVWITKFHIWPHRHKEFDGVLTTMRL